MKNLPQNKIINDSGNLELLISEDNLSAYLVIHRSSHLIDEQDIIDLLEKAGIVNGIDTAAEYNKENNIEKEFGKAFLIARADIPSTESELDYEFDTEKCIDPANPIDLFTINDAANAVDGQVLANLSAKKTTDKYTVTDIFGHKIEDVQTTVLEPKDHIGKNISFSREKQALLADKNGYIYFDEDNKINILDEISIKENIIGKHLILYGNIIIKGDIEDSFIQIHGNLNAKGQIRNCLEKSIVVNGNAVINTLNRAQIISSGKLILHKRSLASVLKADGEIIGENKSTVDSSLLRTAKNITLYNTASASALTELEITASPFLKHKIDSLQKTLEEMKKGLVDDKEEISKINTEYKEAKKEFSFELDNYLSEREEHFVKIINDLKPELYVRFLNSSKIIKEKKNNIIITKVEENIIINDIDK